MAVEVSKVADLPGVNFVGLNLSRAQPARNFWISRDLQEICQLLRKKMAYSIDNKKWVHHLQTYRLIL